MNATSKSNTFTIESQFKRALHATTLLRWEVIFHFDSVNKGKCTQRMKKTTIYWDSQKWFFFFQPTIVFVLFSCIKWQEFHKMCNVLRQKHSSVITARCYILNRNVVSVSECMVWVVCIPGEDNHKTVYPLSTLTHFCSFMDQHR